MNLTDELAKMVTSLNVPAEVSERFENSLQTLADKGAAPGLVIGDLAPDFTLKSATGEDVSLAARLQEGAVVLSFYRGDWCGFCNLELQALKEAHLAITAAGATLLAISAQDAEHAQGLIEKYDLPFELLSDPDMSVIEAYKLRYTIPEDMRQFGPDLTKENANQSWDVPVPATFILDRSGRVTARHVSLDHTKRMDPADALDTLNALAYFEAIFRSAPLSMSVVNREGVIIDHNLAATRLFGKKEGESAVGMNVFDIPEENLSHVHTLLREILDGKRTFAEAQGVTVHPKDRDEELIINYSSAPLTVSGKLIGAVNMFQDVTEQTRQSRELQTTQTRLVQSEKMAALGNLVAGIAHEINNPLAAIKSNIDVNAQCIRKLEEWQASGEQMSPDDARLQKIVDILGENMKITKMASDRVMEIVKNLKSFVRLDEADFQLADLHQEIESTLTLLEHEIRNRVEVEKSFGDIPQIYIYPNQINQVFMNVFYNGIQAMEGKGKLSIRTMKNGQDVMVEVQDSGKGISKEDLEKIFEAGYTTKRGSGAGLGLAICRDIMTKHKGSIEFESKVNEGTKVTLTLPISKPTK